MTELRACAHCGTAEGELTEFNGRLYCPDCLDDLTLVCTDCGSRFLRTHNRSESDDFPICPECYDRDYTRCVRCGRIIDTDHCWYPLDNDDPYCADCCSTIENSPIHDYYFKPYPIFYGDGPRYFGVELEIDDGGECDSSAEALMDIANQSKTLAYCSTMAHWTTASRLSHIPCHWTASCTTCPGAASSAPSRNRSWCST